MQNLKDTQKPEVDEYYIRPQAANARKYAGNGYYWELRKYYLELSEQTIEKSPELMAAAITEARNRKLI